MNEDFDWGVLILLSAIAIAVLTVTYAIKMPPYEGQFPDEPVPVQPK